MTNINYPIQTALLSTTDKTGIIELANELQSAGVKILSTSGTAHLLQQQNIPVTEIAIYTGFPEIMDGRVKTLHPKIAGGILARRDKDQTIMEQYAINAIDLVVVNLYPFQKIIAQPNCDHTAAIENIDIGGPTLIRAAAKNYKYVTLVVDPTDYPRIISALKQNNISEKIRFELAKKAFAYISQYDAAIANYFAAQTGELFPDFYMTQYQKKQDLRYGENPHQRAAFYSESPISQAPSITSAKQIQGKELSFNNIADADTALECVKSFAEPACVIVKHANPCGVALGNNIFEAYQRAYATDQTSAFGGIIAFNRPLDKATAITILQQQFVELIIAPFITVEAQKYCLQKPNIRLLTHDIQEYHADLTSRIECKNVNGGLLVQEYDQTDFGFSQLKCVTDRVPTSAEQLDLLFAWNVAKFVKSNAIVFAKNQTTIGIGAGQTSRAYSTRIATLKAVESGLQTTGAIMASDAFFPFRDAIELAAKTGITAIIQPGGSIRDNEVIEAANKANIAMLFTGTRNFRH